jgi:hypothetical protein
VPWFVRTLSSRLGIVLDGKSIERISPYCLLASNKVRDPHVRLAFKGVPMLDMELQSLARGFRARAKEILLRAEAMNDADARVKMREIAAGYERLAQRVEPRDPRKAET